MTGRRISVVVAALLAVAPLAAATVIPSPGGNFLVSVERESLKGGDVIPMVALITPVGGGKAFRVTFQIEERREPTAERLARAFLWSPDERIVAIEHVRDDARRSYRMVPLSSRLLWPATDVPGLTGEWADRNRFVHRGDAGADGHVIGVFDARSGRTTIYRDNVTQFTTHRVVSSDASGIVIRETTPNVPVDDCHRLDTDNRRAEKIDCP